MGGVNKKKSKKMQLHRTPLNFCVHELTCLNFSKMISRSLDFISGIIIVKQNVCCVPIFKFTQVKFLIKRFIFNIASTILLCVNYLFLLMEVGTDFFKDYDVFMHTYSNCSVKFVIWEKIMSLDFFFIDKFWIYIKPNCLGSEK